MAAWKAGKIPIRLIFFFEAGFLQNILIQAGIQFEKLSMFLWNGQQWCFFMGNGSTWLLKRRKNVPPSTQLYRLTEVLWWNELSDNSLLKHQADTEQESFHPERWGNYLAVQLLNDTGSQTFQTLYRYIPRQISITNKNKEPPPVFRAW